MKQTTTRTGGRRKQRKRQKRLEDCINSKQLNDDLPKVDANDSNRLNVNTEDVFEQQQANATWFVML